MSQSGAGRIAGWMVAVVWAATLVLVYFELGWFAAQAIEGQDRSLIARGPLWLGAVGFVVAFLVTVVWARGLWRSEEAQASGRKLGRRRFLVGAATGLGGIVASGGAVVAHLRGWMMVTGPALAPETPVVAASPRPEWQGARVREYRRLGRTGFEVSDISLGSGRIKGEAGEKVARQAIERGINYFDTAPDYSESGSELALGRAIKGHRDKMFLATKFCTPHGNLPAGTSVQDYMAAVEGSLERLQTDYVDLIHIHACDSLERLLDPNVHEAFDRLKQQGKARFIGFSSHTPNLEQVANTALEDGRFDVMMLAYHHGAWPLLGDIVDRADAADVGVVAMKTLKGAKHRGLLESRDEADAYTQAAFKWVLGNPGVACLVISFREPSNLDEYLYASGKRLRSGDQAVLQKYDRLIAGTHCFQHCGVCLDACPENVPIDDVLRHRMYFEDYGDEKEAMRLYSKLERKADVCLECSAPCIGACPFGISIQERTSGAHQLLTLA